MSRRKMPEIPEWAKKHKECDNPACRRMVDVGVMYCCSFCMEAHEGKYAPVHTVECQGREREMDDGERNHP